MKQVAHRGGMDVKGGDRRGQGGPRGGKDFKGGDRNGAPAAKSEKK